MDTRTALHLSPLLLAVAACTSASGKAPALASSGGKADYAVHYSDELTSVTKTINDVQTRRKTLTTGFAAHVEQLKKPDWQKVEVVIDDSDEAGKATDFADAQNEAQAIKGFWDAEKNAIAGRVNESTQAKLKESGCTGDVGGTLSYSMGDAINKQLQKRLRAKNEAFVVIERYKTSLGPQNTSALEKLADDVAESSFDVHVLMVNQRNRLTRLVNDRSEVKKTLDRYIQEETDFQAEAGRTDAEKKASTDRITAAKKSKADVDATAGQVDAVAKDLDKQIETATKEHEDAVKDLKAKVAEKKKAETSKT